MVINWLKIMVLLFLLICITISICALLSTINLHINMKMRINQIKFSEELLKSIEKTIQIEISHELEKYEIIENNKYNPINIDKDIEILSKRVFDAYKKDIFSANNTLFTSEYLMRYITNYTTTVMLSYTAKKIDLQKER